jgi:hypothetical protein
VENSVRFETLLLPLWVIRCDLNQAGLADRLAPAWYSEFFFAGPNSLRNTCVLKDGIFNPEGYGLKLLHKSCR